MFEHGCLQFAVIDDKYLLDKLNVFHDLNNLPVLDSLDLVIDLNTHFISEKLQLEENILSLCKYYTFYDFQSNKVFFKCIRFVYHNAKNRGSNMSILMGKSLTFDIVAISET